MQHFSFISNCFLSTNLKIKKHAKHCMNTRFFENTCRSYSQFPFEKYLTLKNISPVIRTFYAKSINIVALCNPHKYYYFHYADEKWTHKTA
ncbi:MAG: hypothetical protein A2W93_11380 [Bacteroidetes bacterium GWF2_43_63]|nr:MAG: hypothetical protein A2W94_14255 [Bacteroidetes bacterium GWE2_42_42]OFY54873.1 MAG: hypothetical protein A2W93_11380 [Bacteroidetes bacterium GWF2_43_63]HCB63221.1 hypothetical protein [Bacteroidales bacterium]HCY22174.1 hypothetical protein [Bacteroidales bacterium]